MTSAISCWLQLGLFLAFIRVSPRYRGLGWGHGRPGPDVAAIGALLRLGVPMACSVLMEVGMFTAATLGVSRFGDAAVSSHQVALNIASVSFMVPLGLALAVTVRVGNAVGRGDHMGVRRAGMAGLSLTLATQSLSCAAMLALPVHIVRLYTADPLVLPGAVALLYLAALFQMSDGVQVVCNGALRGLKDARVPMLITGLAYWGVGLPLGWSLAFGLRVHANHRHVDRPGRGAELCRHSAAGPLSGPVTPAHIGNRVNTRVAFAAPLCHEDCIENEDAMIDPIRMTHASRMDDDEPDAPDPETPDVPEPGGPEKREPDD